MTNYSNLRVPVVTQRGCSIEILLIILMVLCLPSMGWAAAQVASVSGNLNDPATLGGATWADGDTLTINTGVTVTVTANAIAGVNTSASGHAITINATDATTYGKLIVADGVSLTLRGYDLANNSMMLINRYAVFEPAPGATIIGDVAGDYTSMVVNKGIINSIGTAAKPITYTSPAGAYSWNNDIATEAQTGTAWKYDPMNNIGAVAFTHYWISNAAGTDGGSMGDSSVSFSAKTPATILTTEVATLSAVISEGTYYIDYDLGVVWFYHVAASGNPLFTKTYKYLTVTKGWGISSIQNTTYNEAKFNYSNFSYMGKSVTPANVGRTLDIQNKNSATSAAGKLAYVTNSTFTNCTESIGIKAINGTVADLIQITGNTFNTDGGSNIYGGSIGVYRDRVTYLNISNNMFKARNHLMLFSTYSPATDHTGLTIKNNIGLIGASFIYTTGLITTFGASDISGNTITGIGNTLDYRVFNEIGGTSGSPVLIYGNTISSAKRTYHYSSYSRFYTNVVINSFHHGAPGPTLDDVRITDVQINNNFFGTQAESNTLGYDSSPSIEIGYNHRLWVDDFRVYNNTFVGNPSGWFGFGDMQDTNTYTTATRIAVYNNIGMRTSSSASVSMSRRANSASSIWRGHVQQFDYNLDYNYPTRYANIERQGTFSGLTNVTGVALWSPNFVSKTGGGLVYTHTSDTDRTLAWGGGTAVQLILDSGTATSAGTLSTQGVVTGGTLTNTSKTYSTTKTDAACPQNHWLLITGGTGSGQQRVITNNTATVLSVAPQWTTVPDATSTYTIVKAEVTLQNSGATETLQAGIYLPDLPGTSQTDSSVSFADHSISSDPLLANASGVTLAAMTPSATSPAKAPAGYGGTYIGAVAPESPVTPPSSKPNRNRTLGFTFGFSL